jgi:signal transduction histidine kinase/DNA-binding response OmpR family regulator
VTIHGRGYLFGAAAITGNGNRGGVVGWLIALRAIDAQYQAKLDERVGAQVSLRLETTAVPGLTVGHMPLAAQDIRFDGRDDRQMVSRFVLTDLGAGRRFEAEMRTERTMHAAAVSGARLLLASTAIAGVLATLFAVWFISRRLLSPLEAIGLRLRSIGASGQLDERLPDTGRTDEIGLLASSINGMLARLAAHEHDTQHSRDAALTASRVKSEFVARMSHEIRTPMNGVLGMTELLQRTELNDRQRKFCATIHRSATSLLDLVNDILDFSKMEAGRLLLQPVPFLLQDAVEDVVELLAGRAHAKHTEIIVAVDPAVPARVVSDPVRLNQILTNLIGNAIKFTDGGEIVVGVRLLAGRDGEATLEFEVRDTGIGIAPDAVGRIFESFAQADNFGDASLDQQIKGTGLGLAIARQLVELMGGRIGVASTPGAGSVFTFTIVAGIPAEASARAGVTFLRGRRVLVAEDNPTAAAVLAGTLERLGARVVIAHDADGALAALAAGDAVAPDLVLIDHVLRVPELRQRLAELREGLGVRAPRVVLLSPVLASADGALADMLDIDAYLTRPVRASLLLATVARVLGIRDFVTSVDPLATGEYRAHRRLLGLRVLVVEDNPVNRDVALGMLQTLGCSALAVADGDEALAVLEHEAFEVILMDRQMPGRDGLATAREIRRREAMGRSPPTPIIALTAHAMPGSREECLAAGMNEFLLKPFSLSELSRTLARHAPRRASSAVRAPAAPAEAAAAPELRSA